MIDWQRVNELRDEVGAEDFEEVVDLFLEEVGHPRRGSAFSQRLRAEPWFQRVFGSVSEG